MTDITFRNHDPDVMLELWHVTKRFGGLTAVGDVSFKIKKGEIYALIGPNGAGKTTIFNLITGVYALTEGRVIFNGTVIGQGEDIIKDDMRETEVKPFQKKPYDIMSRGMARTFQNIRLFKSETVYNNVLTACHAGADYNIFQSLWRFKVGPKWLTKYYWQEKALRDCDCLVIGWGRIGRALTEMLVALGARATVASRAERSRRQAQERGAQAVETAALSGALSGKRLVFSTPPFPVLQEAELARAGREACIIDLASPPYGVDVEAAHRLGLRAWREPGLPGRYCPESAALAIAAAFVGYILS